MHPITRRLVAVTVSVASIMVLAACGTTDVTKGRLEKSVAPTFANLYVHQANILGHAGVTVASTAATATCDRGGPKVADKGPGADWICMIHFTDDTRAAQDGKFELQVNANSCYAAGGPSKLIGLTTITDTNGRDVPNPVFEFDACFDPAVKPTGDSRGVAPRCALRRSTLLRAPREGYGAPRTSAVAHVWRTMFSSVMSISNPNSR
jgi:hypothetical protein